MHAKRTWLLSRWRCILRSNPWLFLFFCSLLSLSYARQHWYRQQVRPTCLAIKTSVQRLDYDIFHYFNNFHGSAMVLFYDWLIDIWLRFNANFATSNSTLCTTYHCLRLLCFMHFTAKITIFFSLFFLVFVFCEKEIMKSQLSQIKFTFVFIRTYWPLCVCIRDWYFLREWYINYKVGANQIAMILVRNRKWAERNFNVSMILMIWLQT